MARVYPEDAQEGGSALARERVATDSQTGEPSMAQLLGDLISDAQSLVRKEFELARQEITEEINKAREGAIALGIGAGVAAAGGIMLLLMIVHMLVDFLNMPLWLAYLIVGAVLAIVGGVMLSRGASRIKQVDPMPRETVDSVRKDVEWLKEQSQSDRT